METGVEDKCTAVHNAAFLAICHSVLYKLCHTFVQLGLGLSRGHLAKRSRGLNQQPSGLQDAPLEEVLAAVVVLPVECHCL